MSESSKQRYSRILDVIVLEDAAQHRGHGKAHVVTAQMTSGLAKTVPCTKLDDFIRDHPVPNVVNIDVEGAESEVLKGQNNN